MAELVNRGDYQLQDETLSNEIQSSELDKVYYKSMIIAYIDEIINVDLPMKRNLVKKKKLLIHMNLILDSIFIDDHLLDHVFNTPTSLEKQPYF